MSKKKSSTSVLKNVIHSLSNKEDVMEQTEQTEQTEQSNNESQQNESDPNTVTEEVSNKEETLIGKEEVKSDLIIPPKKEQENKPSTSSKVKGVIHMGMQDNLVSFYEKMKPGVSISPEDGGKLEYLLWSLIKGCLTLDQTNFNTRYHTLLTFANEHKDDVFSDYMIHRFPDQWPGSPNEYAKFRRMTFLINQTANTKKRKEALRNINIEKALEGFTEDERARIISFYDI